MSAAEEKAVIAPVPARHDHAASLDRDRLLKLAIEIMPCADLRRYVPRHPAWCRRIGNDVWFRLMLDRDPDPSEIQLLLEAHARAIARRDHERAVKRGEQETRGVMEGQRVQPGTISPILDKVGEK